MTYLGNKPRTPTPTPGPSLAKFQIVKLESVSCVVNRSLHSRILAYTFRPSYSMDTSRALFISAVFLVLGYGEAFDMRWCTISNQETQKCNAMKPVMEQLASNNSMSLNFSCVQGANVDNCMEKIKNGQADLITLDGGEINTAGKDHSLVPVVGEDYGAGHGISYKAVAVAKKSKNMRFKALKGKKSCHTGAGKTAGWNVPVGTLLREGLMMPDKSCNAYVAASKFFSESCVPRVKSVYQGNYNVDNLCALCQNECVNAASGGYSNYDGAFRCLEADAGDVAFIKHTTVADNAGNSSIYEYLCLNDTTSNSPDNCFLAKVPSHAVMTKSGHSHIASFKQLLVKASEMYGENQTDWNMFQMFNSSKYGGGKNLLFKDSTTKLVNVGDKDTYTKWLGDVYLQDLEALSMCGATEPPKAGSQPNKPQLVVTMVFLFAMVIPGVLFE